MKKHNLGYTGSTFRDGLRQKDYNFIQAFMLFLVAVAVGILLLDFFGFMMWAVSGQNPVDGFYVGRLTSELIR
jgi:hypothetical protein